MSDGPQFGWTGRVFLREVIVCGTMILFVNLFVRLFPHIRSVRRWIHIEDKFTIDAELVQDMRLGNRAWTVIKRPCEVSLFKEGCKAPWDVKIKEDWAEIHPL